MKALHVPAVLALASQPLLAAEPITVLKDLNLETALVRQGQAKALIVAPAEPGYQAVAELIREGVGKLAPAGLPIRAPEHVTEADFAQSNLILIGNAADNPLVRRLVWERWILDAWRPGEQSFVVRSVHNPFGHGTNVIFVGGENPTTVRAAAEKLLSSLTPGDPLAAGWLMTFETDKRGDPVTEETRKHYAERAEGMLSFKNGRRLISSAASVAKSYYRTGQEGWADIFTMTMRKHREIGAPGMGTHMNVYDTVSMWELIEESPAFSDEDRLLITNHLLYLLRSKEGCMNSFFRKGTKQPGVRHNHQTLPGLACLFGGRYFKLGYGLPEADEWLAAGKALFDSQKISHKPQCDCNCYEWGTLYQTGWWSLGSGDYAFFESGTYRQAADRAIIELDNRGYSSCNGDFWALNYFPLPLFRQAAAFYRDGRYEWAIHKCYGDAGRRQGVADMVRGVEPVEPTDLLGIAVAPMSPDFYNARQTTMPSEPEPNIPLRESFDKISFRRSFAAEDQYLLLDGIGRGSHGHVTLAQHQDASQIIGPGEQISVVVKHLQCKHGKLGIELDPGHQAVAGLDV